MDTAIDHLQYARSMTRQAHLLHLEQLRVAACKDLTAHRERLAKAIKLDSAGNQQTPRDAIASAEARLQVINELRQAADAVLNP